jgi:DME family drug/metabolite transporter
VRALGAAAGAGALWGTGALVVSLLIVRFGMAPGAISWWRFAVGAVVLTALFGRTLGLRATRDRLTRSALAGAGMAGYVLAWFLGIERLGAAVPTLIALCLPPVLVTLVGIARRSVSADAALWLVLAAAIGGTVLILAPSLGDASGGSATGVGDAAAAAIGVAFALASAVLYALVSLLSGRLAVELGPGPSAAAQSIAAAIVTALAVLVVPLGPPDAPEAWAWLAYLGIATTAVALLAFSWGAARLTPTALTVATLVEPLTAVVLAAVLLAQPLAPVQWVGAAWLLGAILVLGRRRPPIGGTIGA